MARIIDPDGTMTTDWPTIEARLAPLGVALHRWPLPEDPDTQALLNKARLDDNEKEALLQALDHRFETLRAEAGYATRDLVVLHPDIPNLRDALAKFEDIHYHTDDEVRYVVDGTARFGFVEPDGGQCLLEMAAGEYINVPANTEHWFTLAEGATRLKAVRYFIDTSGWAPVYTERDCAFDAAGARA